MTLAEVKTYNPLFLVLAVLSAIPAAICLFLYLSSNATVMGAGFLWSSLWTWVWWAMAKRYK
jgi:hypothetical protein